MATTTATIFIGHAHQNHSGINPTHLIRFTENDHPALILQSLESKDEPKVIIPTIENTIDDIYLMIAVFILKKVTPTKEILNLDRISLYEILESKERFQLYEEAKNSFEGTGLKVVFNILDGSSLLSQVDLIKKYPNDYEITLPFIKYEYNVWSKKTELIEL